ncbi:MAG: hypothetical protein AB7E55_21840 [Pigmentiphaga sp.]|nr:hypothetical protein [Pigmentiphaga sp.]
MADLRLLDFMFNEEPAFIVGISTVGSEYIFHRHGGLVGCEAHKISFLHDATAKTACCFLV